MKKSRVWQAIVPGTQNKPQDTLARRDETASCRPSARAKGSGRQLFQAHKTSHKTSNQENTLARRGETASCRPSARPNVTPEPNEEIKPGKQKKPQDTLQIRKTPWHGVTKQPPAAPVPGPNVTPEPNEKIKGLAGTSTVPGTETKPQDTLQIRKTPWHGVTKQPPAVPLPGPNVTE